MPGQGRYGDPAAPRGRQPAQHKTVLNDEYCKNPWPARVLGPQMAAITASQEGKLRPIS